MGKIFSFIIPITFYGRLPYLIKQNACVVKCRIKTCSKIKGNLRLRWNSILKDAGYLRWFKIFR